jgi:membrane fusion protein, copper/silver efflux system
MRGLLVVCVVAGQALAACSGAGGERASVAEAQQQPVATPTGTPSQKLISAYLGIQKKLAADDAKGARTAYGQLKAAADAKDLPGDAAVKQRISASAATGAAAKDLAAARDVFAKTSDGMVDWLKREGNPLANNVQLAHCPMAQDGKGANWLQTEGKLANPYFGTEMLECGTLEKELKPGAKL